MERESVLNSFRLQFHSFFIFHLSLSLVVCNTNTQLFFVLLGRWNLFFFYNFFVWDFDPLPFFFLSFSLVFSKVLSSSWVQHPQETFGLHNVVIALFEEERLFEEEEEEE